MRACIEVPAEAHGGTANEWHAWMETLITAKFDPDTEFVYEEVTDGAWRVRMDGPDEIVRPAVTATMTAIHRNRSETEETPT